VLTLAAVAFGFAFVTLAALTLAPSLRHQLDLRNAMLVVDALLKPVASAAVVVDDDYIVVGRKKPESKRVLTLAAVAFGFAFVTLAALTLAPSLRHQLDLRNAMLVAVALLQPVVFAAVVVGDDYIVVGRKKPESERVLTLAAVSLDFAFVDEQVQVRKIQRSPHCCYSHSR
jgi:cytochrome bd-type quinol oxidase subunit 1